MAICITLAGASIAGDSPAPAATTQSFDGASSGEPAPGMFLVAMRALDDSHFGRTVVYLVDHGEDGSVGLIVNRSSDISLFEVVPDIEDGQATAHELNYGGPVGLPVIIILARDESPIEGMKHVIDNVFISSDRSVLEALLAAKKPASEVRFYLGYSGWAAGQLDFELERDSWHVVAADTDAIFSAKTDSLWDLLIERLEPDGIQVDNRPSLRMLAYGNNPCCQ